MCFLFIFKYPIPNERNRCRSRVIFRLCKKPPVSYQIQMLWRRRSISMDGGWSFHVLVLSTESSKRFWLVLWNILYFYDFPIILGMSSSKLTFTPSFFRGVGQPPTHLSSSIPCHVPHMGHWDGDVAFAGVIRWFLYTINYDQLPGLVIYIYTCTLNRFG